MQSNRTFRGTKPFSTKKPQENTIRASLSQWKFHFCNTALKGGDLAKLVPLWNREAGTSNVIDYVL